VNRSPVLAAAALALATASCSQQAGIDFEPQTQPPLDTTLTEDEIRIFAGVAVAVDAIPLSAGEPADDGTTVALESQDVNVLGVDPGASDGVFVIYGVSPGTAAVRVYMNSEPVGDIPATVLDQGDLP